VGKHKQIWLFVICCFHGIPCLKAVPPPDAPLAYSSQIIQRLYTRLQDFTPHIVYQDTIHENRSAYVIQYMEIIRQDLSFPVQVVQYPPGYVFHIGFPFFPENSPVLPDAVQTFLERYFLELLLNRRPQELLNQDHLLLTFNRAFYGSLSFQDVGMMIPKIIRADQYTLYTINNTLLAEWISGKDTVRCRFPRNLQLISGLDTRELEDNLINSLDKWQKTGNESSRIRKNPVSTTPTSVFLKKGKEFYHGLSQDQYVNLSTGDSQMVYHSDFPEESLQNALLHPTLFSISPRIELTVQIYDPITDTLNYPHLFHGFSMDHDIYAGIENQTRERFTWVLLIHHPHYDYIHLMTLDIPVQYMTSREIWTGKLYPYIRQDNVTNIFSTLRQASDTAPVRIHLK